MKRCMQFLLLLSVFGLSLFYGPPDARAHGTDYSLVEGEALTAVAFNYSDGEPMAYAEVLVFSPQDPKVEHQNGRTDKHGKFAFCPDMPGAWRISANDGMGHLCEATVEIGGENSPQKADELQSEMHVAHRVDGSKSLKVIAGLSLIVNLAFAAHFFYRRLNSRKRSSGYGTSKETPSDA